MRIFRTPEPIVREVPVEVVRKTNLTRPSTLKAVTELKRVLEVADNAETESFVISGKDLIVFDRLIDYAFNVPASCHNGFPADANVDGYNSNYTGV